MQKKKGISLIVLVITIIVMIILASAIIMSLDNTNIFNKAEEAVNKTNNKALEQQAALYEIDLKLEFSELGLGNVILSKDAKEAYIDAIKKGKTEEEARQVAKDTFIGGYYDWALLPTDNKSITCCFEDKVDYTPMYKEVKRIIDILEDSNQDLYQDLNIDESIVPEDLVNNLKEYQQLLIDYEKGLVDNDIYVTRYEAIEPLNGLLKRDPNNKYFYEIAKVKLPYYIYTDFSKTDITTVVGLNFQQSGGGMYPAFNEITVLTLDENYTVLNEKALPPINKDAKIIFPNTLKTIKKGAFIGSNVTKIELPSSVETIEEDAFQFMKRVSSSKITELIIKKEKGSIPGEPWGLNPEKTTIIWQPE